MSAADHALAESEANAAATDLVRRLLAEGVVDAAMVPRQVGDDTVAHCLTSSPERVPDVALFTPLFAGNAAREVRELLQRQTSPRKAAVLLRPCESRALIELAKLEQTPLDGLLTISGDCLGTYDRSDYAKRVADNSLPGIAEAIEGGIYPEARLACQTCQFPTAPAADLLMGLLGTAPGSPVAFLAQTDGGRQALEALGIAPSEEAGAPRQQELDRVRAARKQAQAEALGEARNTFAGPDALHSALRVCIACRNCMRVCPICYCERCFFETHEAHRLVHPDTGPQDGPTKLPSDVLFYHIGRMTHMILSCVGCGACEDACPASIPLTALMKLVAEDAQALFGYVPGLSLEDELPSTTYREKELPAVAS
jgi:formate dehydrogenase subunit beta